MFPLEPFIPDGVYCDGEEKEYVTPHHFPKVIVKLQEYLVIPESSIFDYLIVPKHLDKPIHRQYGDAEQSRRQH